MKRTYLHLIFLISISIAVSGCLSNPDYGDYRIDFRRYYTTEDEFRAIEVAEYINYTRCLNLSRYWELWTNYIDCDVIDHYNRSYFSDESEDRKADVTYVYHAWAKYIDPLNVTLQRSTEKLIININGSEIVRGLEDHSPIDFDYYRIIIGQNISGEWIVPKGIYSNDPTNLNILTAIGPGYYVEMRLSYDDSWGPKAAIFEDIYQVVFMDKDFQPMLIIVSSYKGQA